MMRAEAEPPRDGVLIQASGPVFRRMAVKLARSLGVQCPGLAVDLFTDAPLDDPAFAQVHADAAYAGAGKIPAMRASRFDRTLYMDADMMAVADLRDVFEVLDAFDIALCHDPWRNTGHAARIWRSPLPPAYPQFNGGLIAWRRGPATDAFLAEWQAAVAAHGKGTDQPALRELLWLDRSLRVATLPPEYNLWDLKRIDGMSYRDTAPRVLHNNFFKKPRVLAAEAETLPILLGQGRLAKLRMLLEMDASLTPPEGPPRPLDRAPSRRRRWAVRAAGLRDLHRVLRRVLKRPYP